MLFKFPNKSKVEQWIVILVGVGSSISAGQCLGWPLGALPKLRSGEAGFDLSPSDESWMITAVFIGNILSPFLLGMLMDRFGRRKSILALSTTILISWVLILAVHRLEVLHVARLLQGVWVATVYTIFPAYLSEVVQPQVRGLSVSLLAVSLSLGCLPMASLGPYVSYDVLSIVALTIGVIVTCGLIYIPESPYYYIARGNEESGRSVLSRVRKPSEVQSDMTRITDAVAESKKKSENTNTLKELFCSPSNRKALLIVLFLGMVQRVSGLSLLFTYSSVILPDTFISGQSSSIIVIGVWLVFGAIGVRGVDLFGRRIMFTISSFGCSLAMAGVSVWYYLDEKTDIAIRESYSWVPLALLALHGVVYSIGVFTVPNVIQGELFPIEVRGLASSLAGINMAFFSGVVLKSFYPMKEAFGIYSEFLICVTWSFFGGVFAIFFMFETKGKTLEEIQRILEGRKQEKNQS